MGDTRERWKRRRRSGRLVRRSRSRKWRRRARTIIVIRWSVVDCEKDAFKESPEIR